MTRMMIPLRLGTRCLLLAGAALAAACGGSGGSGATATATPTATASPEATGPLDGTWTTVFSGTEQAVGAPLPAGTWTLKFSAGGYKSSLFDPNGAIFGTETAQSVTATTLVLPADPRCVGQVQATTGTYTYAISGSQLTFTEVSDSCGNRALNLTAHPWSKH